jgi:hypothetical protein
MHMRMKKAGRRIENGRLRNITQNRIYAIKTDDEILQN